MQFHLNGFRPGDPRRSEASADTGLVDTGLADTGLVDTGLVDTGLAETGPIGAVPTSAGLPAEVDVLIVGSGPTGLITAAQLSAFPELSICLAEAKPGPLQLGQADGIACRSMEMFQAFGIASRIADEAYWMNEDVFWGPDPSEPTRIRRNDRIEDVEEGVSEMPHVILNQARVHDFLLDVMRDAPRPLHPVYGQRLVALDRPEDDDQPIVARFERADGSGEVSTVRARYVVGCDGARSQVRRSIGLELIGDAANQAWGVMDILAVTDFPDVRLKALVRSQSEGNLLIIPREGGYLVRIYVELDELDPGERAAGRELPVSVLIDRANRVLNPYRLDVHEVAWWSVYEIGQRLCDRFDDSGAEGPEPRAPRVFIAGDACHTHSPKAGQGMNVSMRDGFNLGWKLASVLRGQASPDILATYSFERRALAQELIDFDREFAAMFSAPTATGSADAGVKPAEFQRYFQQHGRFTAGVATHYQPSLLTSDCSSQALARGFVAGTRFHSFSVTRLADARPIQLGHVVEADGRWRLFLFADRAHPAGPASWLAALCQRLVDDEASPLRRFTPPGGDLDAVFDVRGVVQQAHADVELADLPVLLRPTKGRFGLIDYEKAFCAEPRAGRGENHDIFDARGVDRDAGAIVVVRPDQHVATVLGLDDFDGLRAFFDVFMLVPGGGEGHTRDQMAELGER